MPEPTEEQNPGDPGTPPIPNPQPTPTGPTPAPSDSGSGDSSSPEKLKAALESERALRQQHERDAKAKAKELADVQAKLKEREDAEKSDAEKLAERAEKAETALAQSQANTRQKALRYAVASAARDLSFHDPDVAYRLLDLADVKFDADDEPQGVVDLVKQLAKDHDYLVKKDGPSGPPATPRANGTNGQLTADEQRDIDRRFAMHTRSRY